MEQLIAWLESYGLIGLFIISFVESFISPVLPDVLLIPMALAEPEKAIYYSLVATGASVLGGYVGYAVGYRLGIPLMKKVVPPRHVETIHGWLDKYGGWAIWLAAMAPIPYKFTSITAGVFKINLFVFTVSSILGRAKRFLLEGILIYYYGDQAVSLIARYTEDFLHGFLWLLALALAWFLWRRLTARRRRRGEGGE
ncbi:MAG: YqaA family protein [Sporomusaceae bacterium]|nr:YqaA family protein [Sporomusaceae bacterium]